MPNIRTVRTILQSRKVIEGAGVHLNRVFGFTGSNAFDPFLLLDDFRSKNPEEYLKGFPWHPHRGIETVTYMLAGTIEHADSLGNSGVIGAGDIQWMTAGSGIIHNEMPKGDTAGEMGGFQLWTNLPAASKMMDPRYQDISNNKIPEVSPSPGITIRIIAGTIAGVTGPVRDIVTDPEYLDVTVQGNTEFRHRTNPGHTFLAYIIGGEGRFDNGTRDVGNGMLVHFNDGDEIIIRSGTSSLRLLLISGNPIREPVAWYGPIVMNTDEELRQAFEEYRNGTFIKSSKSRRGEN